MSHDILSQVGHYSIIKALQACEKLKRTSLVRSDRKLIFGDYGTNVMYTCAGVQVSRCSKKVLGLLHLWKNYQDYIGEY
jgi:hypothetical protein